VVHRSPPEIRCADCGFRNANGRNGIPKTGLLLKFDRKSALAAAVMSTGTVFRQLSVEMRRRSPYGTDICPAGMAEPVSLGPVGLSPLVPVAAGRFQEHAVALRLPIALWAGSWNVAVYTIEEIGYGQQ
jgi:hypothetical protein